MTDESASPRVTSLSAPAEEQAEAFRTFVAYAGRYALNGDKVIHHVEISSIQGWVDTDLIRSIKFEGERIVLITPFASEDGKSQAFELIWQRLPARLIGTQRGGPTMRSE